ncbi:cancer/testis antigen family 45 member A6-like [Saimiri boliviensis]|uniref:cancer/testis antigen family 45 member A6-like n=1 Tax=Saimiri boliviensis TaxID=27679 RepID=UPI003D78B170
MTNETEKVAGDPETVFKHPRESDSPPYQKRQKMALLARKQGAGDGLIGGSAMSKEKKLKTGVGIPPSQLDSQIDDFTGFSKDGLMQKPGRNAPVRVIVTSSFSGDDLEVTEILPFSRIQKDINAEIKGKLMKEILQAPAEVKGRYFESIIKEAARYMRGDLIQNFEKKLEEMICGYL